jgi:enoyl-CoA hydratase/carnithine racemase
MLKTTQLNIVQESSAFWRVIFDNPPLNLLDPHTIGELQQLAAAIEAADALKVVVFESANPDYFIAHYDRAAPPRRRPPRYRAVCTRGRILRCASPMRQLSASPRSKDAHAGSAAHHIPDSIRVPPQSDRSA